LLLLHYFPLSVIGVSVFLIFQEGTIPKQEKMSQFREQFFEAEKELMTLERENLQQVARMKRMMQSIFEICGGTEYKSDDFDLEGDNDILEINFAGEKVRIKRITLTKPTFGQNLFSSIFQKKWDQFHVRDRTGRIYVDFKWEWLKPLVDFMELNLEETSFLPESNYFLVQILRYFKMDKIFKLRSSKDSLPLMGLDNSRISSGSSLRDYIRATCLFREECLRVDFKSIYSHGFDPQQNRHPGDNYDIRFKSLLCVIDDDGLKAAVFSNQQSPIASDLSSSASTKKKNVFADLFPIVGSKLPAPVNCGDGSKKLEVLEVKANYEKIRILWNSAKNPGKSTSTTAVKARSHTDILVTSLKEYEEELNQEKLKFEADVKFLENERWSMIRYFYKTWNLNSSGVSNAITGLNMILERKRGFDTRVHNRKRTADDLLAVDPSELLDPIVYFNVDREIFPILRSTILRVIPDSQLAVRVSGRWEEQAKKGDIDEEGNLLVNCHKESFRQIIASLRVFYPSGKLRIAVTALCLDFIEETLDYLLIVPDLLVYVD
jgi:hypothetical protein